MSKWFIFTRGTIHPHRADIAMKTVFEHATKMVGVPFYSVVYLNIGNKLWWCWDYDEIYNLGKTLIEKLKNSEERRKHLAKMREYFDRAIEYSEKVKKTDLKPLSKEQLLLLYDELYRNCAELHAWMNTEVDAVDIYPVEVLQQLLKNHLEKNYPEADSNDIYARITVPLYESYLKREQLALARLALQNTRGLDVDSTRKGLEQIASEYWWTTLGWESMKTKSVSEFNETLSEYSQYNDLPERIAKLDNFINDVRTERDDLIKKYKITPEIISLIEIFDDYALFHDLRKEMQVRTAYSFYLILRETASRFDYEPDDLEWLWQNEIKDILNGKKVDLMEIERRKKAVAAVSDKCGLKLLSGDEVIAFRDKELQNENHDIKEFKGVPASRGRVQAIVRVCSGAAEALQKVGKGEILVCGMTLPDYVPAMKRAAAIVTDEGGITSHAAIISRELGTPCITGTKIATSVLKDGDLVEVDADNGIVRKLNK